MAEEDGDLEQLDGTAAPRSLWSGSITFGLLSLSVDLFPAVRSETVPLKMVDEEHRLLTRRYFCPEHDRMLSRDEIVRGYELDEGEYVIVTDEELEGLAPEKSRAIDLRKFIKASEIDPIYFKRSYFLTPAEAEANRAYRLLAETMERSERVGIATFVMRGKEYLVALLAEDGILRAETLRFHEELRKPEDVGLPLDVEPPREDVARFRKAIDALAADRIERDELADNYVTRLRELIERKLESGTDVEKAPETEGAEEEAEIIDLMEVLKRRLQPEAREPAPSASRREGRSNGTKGARSERGRGEGGRGRRAERDDRGRGAESEARAESELEDFSKSELYERAKALGVPGRSKMDREQLLKALRKAGA